ncbi:hypothetical protein [Plastoroseomonas arctica]|uniref:Uncharacterized protein n=1 Tax=Plastoroseomonas arctica TaxID=1509237 RepID=A0AAF1KKJ0_9PROT|nr:hypothetical protein [Plastoroseomonas arctica]MBR0655304.1 hypothetical protein [Plastoroseomonas arctica]
MITDDRMGEMNFPQTPILSFLFNGSRAQAGAAFAGQCDLTTSAKYSKMKEWGLGKFVSPAFLP